MNTTCLQDVIKQVICLLADKIWRQDPNKAAQDRVLNILLEAGVSKFSKVQMNVKQSDNPVL